MTADPVLRTSTTGEPVPIADGIPSMTRFRPRPVSEVLFVEPPAGDEWRPHVAPRRQWALLLEGRAEITTSEGERREFGAGEALLLEDTTGDGHGFTPLTPQFRWALLPIGGSS